MHYCKGINVSAFGYRKRLAVSRSLDLLSFWNKRSASSSFLMNRVQFNFSVISRQSICFFTHSTVQFTFPHIYLYFFSNKGILWAHPGAIPPGPTLKKGGAKFEPPKNGGQKPPVKHCKTEPNFPGAMFSTPPKWGAKNPVEFGFFAAADVWIGSPAQSAVLEDGYWRAAVRFGRT